MGPPRGSAKEIRSGLRVSYDHYKAAEDACAAARKKLQETPQTAPDYETVLTASARASEAVRDHAFRVVGAVEFWLGVAP